MAEYIEREKVIKAAKTNKAVCRCEADIVDVQNIVNCVPAADVRSERHGHWDDSFDGITPVCSVCGCTHSCFRRTPSYCPNCGAKMDGKDDEQNG